MGFATIDNLDKRSDSREVLLPASWGSNRASVVPSSLSFALPDGQTARVDKVPPTLVDCADAKKPLHLLSVVIPARDEQDCIASTIRHLHLELSLRDVPHEIIVVDDSSKDRTWEILQQERDKMPELKPVRNDGDSGFGRAVQTGLDVMQGDAAVIFMADESDDCRDVVRYWEKLNEGHDCVFGSRFMKGGGTIDYPLIKLFMNRMANAFVRILFRHGLNDTTNAFKAYRREVIDGVRPILSPHFNITVELPLKAIVRGYDYTVIPITWRNRRHGVAKLKIKEMGSRYLFIVLYVWLEKYFAKGDYGKGRPRH